MVTIEMNDSYGDGWNGSVLTIVDDANAIVYEGTFSTGHTAAATVALYGGQTYHVSVSAGSYASEVTWKILSDDEILASGGAPVQGVSFAASGSIAKVVLPQLGTYQLTVPNNVAYEVGAYLDVDGDGRISPLDPAGVHSEEPVSANGNLSGINIV